MSMNLNLHVYRGSKKIESVDLFQTPTNVSYDIVPQHKSKISSNNLPEWEEASKKYLKWVATQWPSPEDAYLYYETEAKMNEIIAKVLATKDKKKKNDRIVAEFFVM